MQTKPMPRLQAVLGLEAPLAMTDKGSYIQEDSLQSIEDRLEALETAQDTHDQSLRDEQGKTTTATNALTTAEASVDAIMTEAGLTPSGDLTAKLTALSAKVTEMGGKDGDTPTNVQRDANPGAAPANEISGVDVASALDC